MTDKTQLALDVRFDSNAGENLSVREYLRALLIELWREGEDFNGKRPFGNSGWDYELYAPLIKSGFIECELDSDGYVQRVDEKAAHAFVASLIDAALTQPQAQQAAAVPAGFKLVPVEPTEEMLDAGGDAGDGYDWTGPECVYKAMLDAAPPPPVLPLSASHPMQPIVRAEDGVVRFKPNKIVNDLLEFSRAHGFGLNEIVKGDYAQEDHNQLAQLIGYSVSGWGDLSYAMNVEQADTIAAGITEPGAGGEEPTP